MKTSAAFRQAFTLIEIVIAVAILAILAGAAVPMASKFFTSRARTATRAELGDLSEAALAYFRDTAQLPGSVNDLIVSPKNAGWAGPYLSVSSSEPWSGMSDVQVDAWARAYRFKAAGASVLELSSAGEDGAFGDSADIVFTVDVTPIRREETLAQLATINQAITRYNSQYLPSNPLATKYATLLSRLVSTGFLPATAPYAQDGWGKAFVPDPAGKSPVVAVTSPSLQSTTGSGGSTSSPGNGNSGSKKAKKTGSGNSGSTGKSSSGKAKG